MPNRYKAVFFDVGETLVYAHPSAAEIMAEVCRQMGVAVDAAQLEAAEAQIAPRVVEQQAGGQLYSISAEDSARFWTWFYDQILQALVGPAGGRVAIPVATRRALARRFHERFMALETWRLFPDAVPALEAIHRRREARGLAVGVVSNWEDWLEALLVRLEVARYFDFLIISAGVQSEKPQPAIFHAALDRAGVRPAEALHVGDSLHADVGGARGVGITPVLLDRRGRYSPDRADGAIVIRSLADLPPLLD
jgi:putative hydrolase of the HAD superfamily